MDAFEAFLDNRPVECIPSFIREASELLIFLNSSNFCWLPKMKEQFLVELSLFMAGLSFSIEKDSTTAIKTNFCRRRAGKPTDKAALRNRGAKASAHVEDLMRQGKSQKAAIGLVMEETGIRREELFRWMKHWKNVSAKLKKDQAFHRVGDLTTSGVSLLSAVRTVSKECQVPPSTLVEMVRGRLGEAAENGHLPRIRAAYGLRLQTGYRA